MRTPGLIVSRFIVHESWAYRPSSRSMSWCASVGEFQKSTESETPLRNRRCIPWLTVWATTYEPRPYCTPTFRLWAPVTYESELLNRPMNDRLSRSLVHDLVSV